MRAAVGLKAAEGFSLVELLLVLAVAVVGMAIAVPVTGATIDAGRVHHAANFIASRLRFARQQAVVGERSVALVFDQVGDRWTFRVCVDGNRNGIRRADIEAGRDPCVDGPYDIADLFPGVRIAADAGVSGPDGKAGSDDPVRFGKSDLASFSPAGSCTAGSLLLKSEGNVLYMVRVAGVTARTRVLFYDRPAAIWRAA
jgi:prepilin-type N-terminal cleavage/methylation domain-containing protein